MMTKHILARKILAIFKRDKLQKAKRISEDKGSKFGSLNEVELDRIKGSGSSQLIDEIAADPQRWLS